MVNDPVQQLPCLPQQRLLLFGFLFRTPAHHAHHGRIRHDRHKAGTELLNRYDFKRGPHVPVAADDQFGTRLPAVTTFKTIRIQRFTQFVSKRIPDDFRIETTVGRSETNNTPSPFSDLGSDYQHDKST